LDQAHQVLQVIWEWDLFEEKVVFVKHHMGKVTRKGPKRGESLYFNYAILIANVLEQFFSEYLKEKKEEEEILAELAKKYRDRAKERRDGGEASGPDALATLGAYRAVAPDIKSY
jgi:hypothetical protein